MNLNIVIQCKYNYNVIHYKPRELSEGLMNYQRHIFTFTVLCQHGSGTQPTQMRAEVIGVNKIAKEKTRGGGKTVGMDDTKEQHLPDTT